MNNDTIFSFRIKNYCKFKVADGRTYGISVFWREKTESIYSISSKINKKHIKSRQILFTTLKLRFFPLIVHITYPAKWKVNCFRDLVLSERSIWTLYSFKFRALVKILDLHTNFHRFSFNAHRFRGFTKKDLNLTFIQFYAFLFQI